MDAKDIKIGFHKVDDYKVMVVQLPQRMRVLSTTILNGAFTETDTIVMVQVPISYLGAEPEEEVRSIVKRLGLGLATVGFMTAADMEKVISVKEESYNGMEAIAIATAGVKNAVYAGELIPERVKALLGKAHTINTIVVLGVPLHDTGLANAIITATEAKSAALMDCKVRGTGTTSDAIAVLCPIGKGEKYAGTATDIGICLARAVRGAVAESVLKWYAREGPMDYLQLLDEVGVTVGNMWEAASALIIPNESWSEDFLQERFVAKLQSLRQDVNVTSLIYAAILIDDAGNRNEIFGLDQDRFKEDPVHLLADEVLGIGLAEFLTGTKGLFEYIRYDKKKPGVLGELGPFLDDIVASLIGSVMSMIYSELLEKEGKLS